MPDKIYLEKTPVSFPLAFSSLPGTIAHGGTMLSRSVFALSMT
jgi:hypothetical protein